MPAAKKPPAPPQRPASPGALLSKPGAAAQASPPAQPAKPAAPAPTPAPAKPTGKAGKARRLKLPAANRRIGSQETFWGAVCASLIVHGVLLFIHFALPDGRIARQHDKGLDIVLVNAKHAHAPKDPLALAQANLDGGGNSEKKDRASTPLPPQEQTLEGDALLEAKRQRIEQVEEQQRQLLTQAKNLKAPSLDTPPANETAPTPQPRGLDLYDSARAVARLEAEIDREQREYAARPRKAIVGTRTTETVYAQYVEDWRQKVERIGTLNFPRDARGRVYGSLLLTLEIRVDGTISDVEVTRSSGNAALDAAAVRIVRLSSPFAPFTPEMRKKADILVIARRWAFTKADTLEAQRGE